MHEHIWPTGMKCMYSSDLECYYARFVRGTYYDLSRKVKLFFGFKMEISRLRVQILSVCWFMHMSDNDYHEFWIGPLYIRWQKKV